MSWIVPIINIIATIFALFKSKSEGEKAINTLLKEKDETINKVEQAKIIRSRLDTNRQYADSVRAKYTRQDD